MNTALHIIKSQFFFINNHFPRAYARSTLSSNPFIGPPIPLNAALVPRARTFLYFAGYTKCYRISQQAFGFLINKMKETIINATEIKRPKMKLNGIQ